MNENTHITDSNLSMSRAVRFALATIVIGLSYPNIHCAIAIARFQKLYIDLLGDKPLPSETIFIIHYRIVFIGLSLIFPVLAVTSIFTLGIYRSIYISGIILIAVFIQLFFQWQSLTSPLFTIIGGLQK